MMTEGLTHGSSRALWNCSQYLVHVCHEPRGHSAAAAQGLHHTLWAVLVRQGLRTHIHVRVHHIACSTPRKCAMSHMDTAPLQPRKGLIYLGDSSSQTRPACTHTGTPQNEMSWHTPMSTCTHIQQTENQAQHKQHGCLLTVARPTFSRTQKQ